MNTAIRIWGLALIGLFSSWTLAAAEVSEGFRDLLAEGELRYRPPTGYTELTAGTTPIIDYEHALRSDDQKLEIRLMIRPLKRLRIDYDDPHGSVPDPNHIFPLVFESLASRLAGGRHAPSNEYHPDEARERFNADWAAAAVFDTTEDFATAHSQGLLVAIHRNKVADAYLVFLFDDYAAVKERLNQAMSTLKFMPQPQQTAGPDTD